MIRVLVAAPTPMMRAGLRAMIEADDLEVTGEAASIADLEDGHVPQADVLLVPSDGLQEDQVRALAEQSPLAVMVLSDDARPAALLRELPLRGWGLLPLDTPAPELQAAIRAAAEGLVVLSLPLGRRLVSEPAGMQVIGGPTEEPLTSREREVLALLSQGLSNKLIARRLQISEHTVKFHVSSIYAKLGASSRTEAVGLGARQGLISF